jgi:Protein of unknown function (DUF3046)
MLAKDISSAGRPEQVSRAGRTQLVNVAARPGHVGRPPSARTSVAMVGVVTTTALPGGCRCSAAPADVVAVGRGGVRRYPGAVRLTVFWDKMRAQFGDAYAASVAKDYVLTDLGGRTVDQALADGTEPKTVWRAVCEAFEIPEKAR